MQKKKKSPLEKPSSRAERDLIWSHEVLCVEDVGLFSLWWFCCVFGSQCVERALLQAIIWTSLYHCSPPTPPRRTQPKMDRRSSTPGQKDCGCFPPTPERGRPTCINVLWIPPRCASLYQAIWQFNPWIKVCWLLVRIILSSFCLSLYFPVWHREP